MSKLHQISGFGSRERKADVLFIHGLGGDAFDTWRHGKDESTSWPHWLGKEFPNIGVWSLGYAASPTKLMWFRSWFSRKSPDSGHSMALPDRALQVLNLMVQSGIGERPLFFVCHSLGGLLAKQTLRLASEATESREQSVFKNARAVLFLATPHAGASLAALLDNFSKIFQTTVSIEDLRAHDAHLRELLNWYRHHSSDAGIQTVTYYETRDVLGARIVDETSAHPGVGADPVGLDEDHISIAKPRERDAQVCNAARDLLRDHVLTPRPSMVALSEPPEIESPTPSVAPVKQEHRSFHKQADISRIIKYAPAELIGRDDELKLISDAWANAVRGESKRIHVLMFVALGGEGKTSLVAKWTVNLEVNGWPGCDAVFAWSFYSQGKREQTAPSSDVFLKEALTFFGDPETAASAKGAFEKARRLAELVGKQRSLLILDGLEPLQYSPGPPMDGTLKDPGIAELLKGLAAANNGLCVVTTRHSIPDLRAYGPNTARETKLSPLTKEAGMALLRKLGVWGAKTEFENLVEKVHGHALTLNLLGSYLHDAHAGDIRKRDLVSLKDADVEEQGGHAFRVVEAYVKWFESDGERGKRVLAVLRLLGLFDRPAPSHSLTALQRDPPIPGLTESLVGISEAQLNVALTRLEAAKLLTVVRDAAGRLISLDAHPLVREYFGCQLRTQDSAAWRAAHRRLYDHLSASTMEPDQPTLEDLQPLYQAVAHGCSADAHVQAYSDVFYSRILRRDEFYSVMHLGAVQSDISAMAGFFSSLQIPSSLKEIGDINKACLLKHLGYCLRASGQLDESVKFLQIAFEQYLKCDLLPEAASTLGVLCFAQILLGQLKDALKTADMEASIAERTGCDWVQITAHSRLAEVKSYMGMYPDCSAHYDTAFNKFGSGTLAIPAIRAYFENLEKNEARGAIIGALTRRCGFCIASGQFEEAITWAETVKRLLERGPRRFRSEVHSGLMCLFTGQAQMEIAQQVVPETMSSNKAMQRAQVCLEDAVIRFQNGSRQNEIPGALLSLVKLAFLREKTLPKNEVVLQKDRLDEAWQIAERGPMRLQMADIHLHRARFFFPEKDYPWKSPQDDLAAAEKLINECGYHRRDEELADAKKAIFAQ